MLLAQLPPNCLPSRRWPRALATAVRSKVFIPASTLEQRYVNPRLLAATALVAGGSRRARRGKVTAKAMEYPWWRGPRPRQIGKRVRKFIGKLFRPRTSGNPGGTYPGKEGSADLVPSRNASPKLVQVLEQLDAADASLELLQGQDVVVMIGPTGTGKTLLLHAIDDRKLKGHRHRQGRLVYEAEMPLAGFDVSHGKASQTKSVQALERVAGDGRKVIYLDSPGFHDTGGAHLDVVTSINLQKVAKMAGSLRFCVVISCDSLHTHRGGAIREVAKLLAKFTSDFPLNRYSFTFIFTHADQLEEFPKRKPKTWKQKLHEILQEILEGTGWSEEYIEVLKWMVQCTDPKTSPEDDAMVFVFNPRQPNAQNLRASLENFSSDGGHTRCLRSKVKLTQETRSWITVEMQRWQESVEACVEGDDIDEVRALLQIADNLARHTDLRDVQEGLSSAVEMISERTTALRKRAVELQQGEPDLGKAKDCLHCWKFADGFATLLGELQPENDMRWDSNERPQVWLPKMADALEGACAGSAPFDDTILMQLQTLYVWAQADNEFRNVWEAADNHAQAYLKRSCAQNDEDPTKKVKMLGALEERLPRLKKLGFCTTGVSDALRRGIKAAQSMIQQDLARIIAAVEEGAVDPKQLKDFWKATRVIDSPAPWARQVRRAGQCAEEEFVKFVSEREASLYSTVLDGVENGDLGCRTREAMEGLKLLQSCWQSPEQGKFLEAVKLTAAKLREMRCTISAFLDWGPHQKSSPPAHGELPELVSRFEESTCLDEFLEVLPEGKDLVEARNDLHSVVEKNKELTEKHVQDLLQYYLQFGRGPLPDLRSYIRKWPEVAKMCGPGSKPTSMTFEGAGAGLKGKLVHFKTILESSLKSRLDEPCPIHLDNSWLGQGAVVASRDLNKALDFLAAENPEIKPLIEEIAEMAQQYLETASSRIETTFQELGNYDQKLELLDKLRDCHEQLKSWLPTYERMREVAEALVSQEADAIRHEEDMVIQGQRIKEFQAALVLDEHLTGHVKFLAENLQQAYESRRLDEEGILREAIEELDVERVQKEVEALSTSEDPTVRKKVEDAVRQFKARLELQLRQTKIENAEAMLTAKRVLRAVDRDSVLHVKLCKEGFNADETCGSLEGRARKHYDNLLNDYGGALRALDLSTARDMATSVQVYSNVCPEILNEVDTRKVGDMVKHSLKQFKDYLGGQGTEVKTAWRDVNRMLLRSLESPLPLDGSPDPLGLSSSWPTIYKDITADVSAEVVKLVEGLTEVPAVVAVATYKFLLELESEWKEHWMVPFNFEEKLQAATEEDARWNVLPTPEKAGGFLQDYLSMLEVMSGCTSLGPVWTAEINREEFQRKREKFEEHLQAAATAIRKALQTNDFKTAGLWTNSVFDTDEDGCLMVPYRWEAAGNPASYESPSFSALREALKDVEGRRKRLGEGLIDAFKKENVGSFRLGLEEAERFTQYLPLCALDTDFREILEAFGVLNHVTYSTITDYSEDTIEAKGDLRGGTTDLVQGKASESGAGKVQVSKDLGCHVPRRRIILLVDATGSMHSLWAGTKSCIEEVLRRIKEIGGSCFDMQIVAYRDYSDEERLEPSARTLDAAVLQRFLGRIRCYGGGDHEEAVELALAYANAVHSAEDPVTKVVILGDAPPHREKKGDKLESHDHTLETDYMLEAEALRSEGIVVDSFWLCPSAAESFQSIAESTGGSAWHLDISGDSAGEPGPEAASPLMDAICESALEDIGGEELVLEYRSRYKHK